MEVFKDLDNYNYYGFLVKLIGIILCVIIMIISMGCYWKYRDILEENEKIESYPTVANEGSGSNSTQYNK